MARQASGAITLTDITDGTDPISAQMTNENHTFSANTTGVVTTAERELFSSEIIVYLGATRLSYNAASTPSSYKLGAISDNNNWSASVTTSTGQAVISIASGGVPSGADAPSGVLIVPVIVANAAGGTATLNLSLTLSKVSQGAGGTIIRLNPNQRAFFLDEEGVETPAGQNDITTEVIYQGSQGAVTIESSVNGAAYANVSVNDLSSLNNVPSGSVKSQDVSGDVSGSDDNFVIGIENFFGTDAAGNLSNATNTVTYKVTSANGGIDTFSVLAVRKGDTGASAIIVVVESNNGIAFKTGTANIDKTLTTIVYDARTGTEILNKKNSGTNDIKYEWFLGDTTASLVQTDASRNVVTSGGSDAGGTITSAASPDYHKLIVGDEDVATYQQYTCRVTIDPA